MIKNERLSLIGLSLSELLFIILACFSCSFLPDYVSLMFIVFMCAAISMFNVDNLTKKYIAAVTAFFPILISAVQNLYLGLLSPFLSEFEVQSAVMVPFLYACFCILFYFVKFRKINSCSSIIVKLLFVILIYSFLLLLIYSSSFVSFIAGVRNLISPICFVLLGMLVGRFLKINDLFFLVLILGTAVCLFGIYELFINPNMWVNLNIGDLWAKKGIAVSSWGLPLNFVSSEFIFGQQMRRMSSSFADPVNLGAFLFAYFVICWYQKKCILGSLAFVSIVLTISKGALLGLLIFIFVKSFISNNRTNFIIAFVFCVLFGIAFIGYSFEKSSGSLMAHFSGFTSGLNSLFVYPFGLGVGNIGVISGLFDSSANASIVESGFGTIVGCLGWIGLCSYIIYYCSLTRFGFSYIHLKRDKVVFLSFVFTMLLNIMFNEVALSPNSCGVYFIVAGCYLGHYMNGAVFYKERYKKTNMVQFVRRHL